METPIGPHKLCSNFVDLEAKKLHLLGGQSISDAGRQCVFNRFERCKFADRHQAAFDVEIVGRINRRNNARSIHMSVFNGLNRANDNLFFSRRLISFSRLTR